MHGIFSERERAHNDCLDGLGSVGARPVAFPLIPRHVQLLLVHDFSLVVPPLLPCQFPIMQSPSRETSLSLPRSLTGTLFSTKGIFSRDKSIAESMMLSLLASYRYGAAIAAHAEESSLAGLIDRRGSV